VGALPFGLAALAVFLWWATEEGGYAPTTWYPGGLIFLALLGGVMVSPAGPTNFGLSVTRAIALLAAFTAWSFLSIVWAGVKGDAWDGANRTLLYLTVYAMFALLCWRARDAAVVVGLFALGTAAVGAAAFASEGTAAFIGGRLAAPTGYANATAALFLAAFWPAVALAARPEVHWAARSFLLAAGGLLLQLAVLAQSRASLVAGSTTFVLYVLVTPERLRALLVLLPVAAVTLASLAPLLEVFASANEAELAEAVTREQQALALSTGALLAIGALVGFMDRPGRIDRRAQLLAGRRRTVVAAVVAGGVLVALVATAGVMSLNDGSGREGVTPGATSALGSSRFGGGLESGRYDLWRVAAGEVADHPLLGVGADNFAVDFTRERRSREEPLYPHSVFLRSFSQTGLVGGGLFLGFVGAALVAALRRRRRSDALANAVASASVVSAVYWLVHGSIDWLWEIPLLAAPALALLGLAFGLGQHQPDRPLSTPRRSIGALAVAGLLFAAAVGSYALPGLAALEVERAVQAGPAAPGRRGGYPRAARRPAGPGPDGIQASARAKPERVVCASSARASRRRRRTARPGARSSRAGPVAQSPRARSPGRRGRALCRRVLTTTAPPAARSPRHPLSPRPQTGRLPAGTRAHESVHVRRHR
jgi:hypothetical protein